MGSMFIEILNKELNGRQLDIWRGHDDAGKPIDMSYVRREAYRKFWIQQAIAIKRGAEPPTRYITKRCCGH